jgi:hypothetical protein
MFLVPDPLSFTCRRHHQPWYAKSLDVVCRVALLSALRTLSRIHLPASLNRVRFLSVGTGAADVVGVTFLADRTGSDCCNCKISVVIV